MTRPIDIACPVGHALPGRWCVVDPTDPPDHVVACEARITAAAKATASDLMSMAGLRAEVARLRAVLADFPPLALAEMRRVLVIGGKERGCAASESGGGQAIEDHLEHANQHFCAALEWRTVGVHAVDETTGALDLVHAACRSMLAAELVLRANGEGR